MKTILILCALVAGLAFSSCMSTRAPAVGPTTGTGQSPHTGNSEGTRTDLTLYR